MCKEQALICQLIIPLRFYSYPSLSLIFPNYFLANNINLRIECVLCALQSLLFPNLQMNVP